MTEKMKKLIGERIRQARKVRGMSQEKLSEKLEISFQAVSSWETGKFIPDSDHLPGLAKELNLSLNALFAEKDPEWELQPLNPDPDHMFTFVKGRAQMMGFRKTLAVMDLLRLAHGSQVRKSRYGFECPYTVHPLTLACHALAMGLRNDDVLAACIAHDMIEDSGGRVTLNDLPEGRVREAVKLVTKAPDYWMDPGAEEKYYGAIREDPLACLVKCLDRINNLSGMADGFSRERMAEYLEETDRQYPALLGVLKKVPEWNDAWWLMRYQMTALKETCKRLL